MLASTMQFSNTNQTTNTHTTTKPSHPGSGMAARRRLTNILFQKPHTPLTAWCVVSGPNSVPNSVLASLLLLF
jgi:hypothetical protein